MIIHDNPLRLKLEIEMNNFCSRLEKEFPEIRFILIVEHPDLKNLGMNKGMGYHEMQGLLKVASDRLTMMDTDDIKKRMQIQEMKDQKDSEEFIRQSTDRAN